MTQILLCETCSASLPRDRCPVPRCPYQVPPPGLRRRDLWKPTPNTVHVSYHAVMYRGMGVIERAGPFDTQADADEAVRVFGTDPWGRHALVYGARPNGTVDVLVYHDSQLE